MPIKRLNLSFIWVGLASALLACSGISTIWLTMQQRSAQGWVTHTFQVEQTLSALQIIEMRAEIERRGYIVTGDSAAATRYLSALHQVPVSVDRLQTFVADNPRQIAKFPALRNAIAQWMSSRQRSVQLVRSGDVQAAATLLGSPVTRATTAKMLGIITSMRDEEERLLAERQYRSSQLQSMVRATPAISLLFLIFLMAFVLNDRRRQMRALQLSHAQLAADIAARKGVESQLALLAANATDAVHRLTLDGVCLYVSPSVESVLGLTPETLIGKSILTGIHPDDIEDVKSHLAQFSRGEMSRAVVTYRVGAPETPDGWIWLEAHAGLVTTTDDSLPAEIIVSVRDITARKTLEIELAAARVRAESAVRAKATFLANMSHEIRTPMNGVIGFTELVLASKLDADQRRQVELIADSGRSMMRLLNDILDLSKVEAGHLKLNAEAISLRHVLNSCVSLMQGSALAKSIALDCQVEPTVPIWLMADGLRIRQVVLNLLGNALKFTDNGHVIVRAGHDATIVDGYWIEVEDSGHGIAPARQMAIFEEFVQASDTTARDHGGTGLGLAISSGLVRLMGGTLTLDSELGRGSRFRFTLQAARCEAPSQTRAPDRGGIAERRRFHRPDRSERILLAEDHDINQELITAMLHRPGRVVDIAQDGACAIAMVQQATEAGTPYDIVLMDMQMPVMGGLEATEIIRRLGFDAAQLPIIALTANAYQEDIEACMAAGMQAHIAKPISIEKLEDALAFWCQAADSNAEQNNVAIKPSLRARYEARKRETLEAVAELVRNGAFTDECVTAVADKLHKLAGTAGMFGESELGANAQAFETGLLTQPAMDRARWATVAYENLRAVASGRL